MGGPSQPTAVLPPTSPDASDENLLAARRARAYSLFSANRGFSADFTKGPSGAQYGAGVTYGSSMQSQLGGQTQFGDDTGTTQAPKGIMYSYKPGGGLVPGEYVQDPNGTFTQAQADSGKAPGKS